MCTTKSKLLSVLAEFNMEGGPIIPCGIFIFDEEQYPFSESDWSLEFTDHHNADGASTIYVNRKTQTLVLVYDSDVNVQYEDTTYGFCYECLVFGDIEFIKGFCDNGIDVNEHSLWYKHECDIPYIEFLCPHLVKDMVFEDDLATNKDVGENKIDSEGLLSSKVAYETYKDLVSLGIDCEFIEIDKQLPLSFNGYCSHVNFPSKVVIKGVPDKEGTKDYVLGVGLDGSTPNYWLCDKSTYVDYDDLMKLSGQLSVELYFHLTSSNVAVHKFIDFDEGLVEFCENGTCMEYQTIIDTIDGYGDVIDEPKIFMIEKDGFLWESPYSLSKGLKIGDNKFVYLFYPYQVDALHQLAIQPEYEEEEGRLRDIPYPKNITPQQVEELLMSKL